ncbi:hypothetical protein F4808DRAFT_423465 [Astrocystis sublimbata]|nr:hypothetical protein F4808DRAFT_423465 [Astrocystis sublimbata]
MATPFICPRCTTRLARSTSRWLTPNGPRLHTSTFPAEPLSHALVLPPRYDHAHSTAPAHPAQVQPQSHDALDTPESSHDAALLAPSLPPHGLDDGLGDTMEPWDGELKKYVRREMRHHIARLATLPPAKHDRQLKGRIMRAMGEYDLVRRDLAGFYALSPSETRQAVSQLTRLLRAQPDMNSVASRLDQYHVWKKAFSALLPKSASTVPGTAATSSATAQGDAASMKAVWQRLDPRKRQHMWPAMILSALKLEPHTLPTLILTTFDPSLCPSYVVEDLLYVLVRRHRRALSAGAAPECGQIEEAIEAIMGFVLGCCPPRYLTLDSAVLHSMISRMSTSELVFQYQVLQAVEHPLHKNTMLHFASHFAKGKDTKAHAVEVLHELASRPGFDLNTPSAASVCSSLLTLNENEPLPDDNVAPDVLFEFLLKRGLRPNVLGLTALMRNFCVRGHLEPAQKIFELMHQHGIEPGPHVYSTLLNACKQNLDMHLFGRICHIITSRNAWTTVLMNDFLDTILRENELQSETRRRQRKKGNNAWRPMLRLYAKVFDLAPLQKYTLFPLENMLVQWSAPTDHQTTSIRLAESLMPLPSHSLLKPDSTTLCLMFGAHMRSITTPKYAIRYYNYYFRLVNRKDPIALKLLKDRKTLMIDILLRNLMQMKSTIPFAIRRLRKMVYAAQKEKAQCGRHIYHHPPSIHTWAIMINGLKNHNDMRGAIAILNIARLSATKPNLPMWNTLIQGFARIRDVKAAVKAVVSLEKAGFQPNDRTIKALNMFPKPLLKQVIARLEQVQRVPEQLRTTTEPLASNFPKATQGISSNMPLHRLNAMTTGLEELARRQEDLNKRQLLQNPHQRSRRLTKRARVRVSLNSDSAYLGGA